MYGICFCTVDGNDISASNASGNDRLIKSSTAALNNCIRWCWMMHIASVNQICVSILGFSMSITQRSTVKISRSLHNFPEDNNVFLKY